MKAETKLSAIQKLQQRVEELIVQLDLGKSEAIDLVETQKEHLKSNLDQVKQSVTGTAAHALHKKIDELRLQLQLGKMETREAYLDQLDKIEEALNATRRALQETKYKSAEEFNDLTHALTDKLHMLALNLGAAGVLAQEKAAETREQLRTKLQRVAGSLQGEAEWTAEKARQTAEDAHRAMDDILDNLKSLLR